MQILRQETLSTTFPPLREFPGRDLGVHSQKFSSISYAESLDPCLPVALLLVALLPVVLLLAALTIGCVAYFEADEMHYLKPS